MANINGIEIPLNGPLPFEEKGTNRSVRHLRGLANYMNECGFPEEAQEMVLKRIVGVRRYQSRTEQK